jgi:aminomethyltransferase
MQAKKTPLYDLHVALGGKMVEFAGYMMPVQYSGIINEHKAVRQSCGLFDVSHMGEVEVTGENAAAAVQRITTNDISNMEIGQVKYSPMCDQNGGVVDDLLIYKREEHKFLLVVNASNIEKDNKFLRENNIYKAALCDMSDDLSQIAMQGPKAESILKKLTQKLPQKYYTFVECTIYSNRCIISRTGYTGEDGFEIYCPREIAAILWEEIMEAGGKDIVPCGLGARDTLRFEASMPLYGHELTSDISPIEAGLKYFVNLDKGNDFVGREALEKQIEEGITRRRCGLEILDRGIAREGAKVFADGKQVGFVTSGTKAVTLEKTMAMAMVDKPFNKRGTKLSVEVRGKKLDAVVVKMPFYKRQ